MSKKTEKLKAQITDAIREDENSIDAAHVLISVVKKGSLFSSSLEVQLSGRVGNKQDLSRIVEIAEKVAGDIPVVSTLRHKD